MTTRITNAFDTIRGRGASTVIPFIVAGHPTSNSLGPLLVALDRAGASILEIGIPFSDPVADGPVIAQAMYESLERGMTPSKVFETVRAHRSQLKVAIVAMVSISILTRLGVDQFLRDAASAGFDGVIVPDADTAMHGEIATLCRANGMDFIPLIASSTTEDRLKCMANCASGFLYALARKGITGVDSTNSVAQTDTSVETITRIRAHSTLPVAVGFGVNSAEDVARVTSSADAAIVGTALVRTIEGSATAEEAAARVSQLYASLLAAARVQR
ncbi:MAG: tryptophan synthase subunit alpha [Planctomycetota bacterium]|nr:tryptophan synthase subunit alpha [Planctomycetota bacterium]